jgi:pimeloyl-ACP methyl ester carboxylesterase
MALLALARREGMHAVAEAWFPDLVARVNDTPALRSAVFAMIERHTPHRLATQILAGRDRPDATALLAHLRVPVLLIAGADDVIRPPGPMEAMAAAIPDGRLAVLERCGHLMTLEQPVSVMMLLWEWLSEVASVDRTE